MKKRLVYSVFLLLFLFSCKTNTEKQTVEITSESDIDAARNFIRAALDGDYETGKKILLGDSVNFQYYAEFEKMHAKLNVDEKNKYKKSSINVHALTSLNDSTTIVIYSNSYKKNMDTLKLLKTSGQWFVDLKYLFNPDSDTIQHRK